MTDTQEPAIRQRVIEWLDDNIHFGDAEQLIVSDETSFLDNGILDSLGFVRLVLFLEDTYQIKVDRQLLTRDNFDSLGLITRFVVARLQPIP